MSEAEDSDEEEEAEPTVELGDGPAVEGAPISRIAARFQWGREKSAIVAREGDSAIRTPTGPRPLADVLEDVEATYFPTRQAFVAAVRDVVDQGPVATED